METKKCNKCGVEKPRTPEYFNYLSTTANTFRQPCRECRCHPRVKEVLPEGHKRCSGCKEVKPFNEFYNNRTESDGLTCRCKVCISKYRYDNKEQINNNRRGVKKYSETSRIWHENKRKTDPIFKLSVYLRSRIYRAFKRNFWNKRNKTKDILGCDFDTAKKYIERLFTKGMSWDNFGEWVIDHRIPLNSAKNEQDLISLCHISNLQPMWAEENREKWDKIIEGQNQTFLPI